MVIPEKLKSLIEESAFAALATYINNGEIQNHLMWIDYEYNNLLINTEQERKKTENIRRDAKLTLLVFHPTEMYRSWEVRGRVIEINQGEDANNHIDKLSQRYINKPYKRDEGVAWKDANIKDREIWIIEPEKIIPMSSLRSQSNS